MTRPARFIAALACSCLCGLAAVAHAQDPAPDRCRPSDIIFLIDDSYSFGNAHAQREAFAAGIQAFLEALGEQHRVGLVSFGTEAATLVAPVTNSTEARASLASKIRAMRFRDPWTNVYAGIDQAYRWARQDVSRRGVIVLISDGVISMPDPNRPGSTADSEEAKAEQLERIRARLPDVVKGGASIYSLAYVGAKTDYALMKEIADKTEGISQVGDTTTLPKIMTDVAAEMCRRDPTPAAAPVVTPATPAVTPPAAVPPPPVAAAPVAPAAAIGGGAVPPVGPSPLLWITLAGGGVAVAGASVLLARRGRRRRTAAAAAAAAAEEDDAFSGGPLVDADAGAGARDRRRGASRPQAAAGDDPNGQYFAPRRGTVSMEAVSEAPKRPPSRAAGGSGAGAGAAQRDAGDSGARAGGPSAAVRTAGSPANTLGPAAAVATGTAAAVAGRPRGGAPPKPGWQEDHLVQIVGYTAGGVVIKETDMRRNGETLLVLGLGAGAILDVPPNMSHVRGSVRYSVAPDGTRNVTIHELPPGGFRDKDTGKALREGDRLTNNMRVEWAKEERGRYLEVLLK